MATQASITDSVKSGENPPALPDDFDTSGVFSHESLKVDVVVPMAEGAGCFGSKKISLKVHTEQVVKNDQKSTDLTVLFLHGMRFSSKNWLDINTLFHVANWGWKAVAVDLPGFGQTKDNIDQEYNADFLSSLISALGLIKPVIVSPSMSGSFSLPFVFADGVNGLERALGYIPVAPVSTGAYVTNFEKSEMPTLIVCGSRDKSIGATSNKHLGHLPKGIPALIEDAGHACYLDNPDLFHKYVFYFLINLKQSKSDN